MTTVITTVSGDT